MFFLISKTPCRYLEKICHLRCTKLYITFVGMAVFMSKMATLNVQTIVFALLTSINMADYNIFVNKFVTLQMESKPKTKIYYGQ